ncbi:hypothetical protein [Fodinicola feengrottensis]|uniref:hypothetical protein n=1 Tax=Fodinicola feengrottensis TaxID=435914 RepID=UPI0013D7982D|nr:hypothetical protein [Fodinicola feengrottensis]
MPSDQASCHVRASQARSADRRKVASRQAYSLVSQVSAVARSGIGSGRQPATAGLSAIGGRTVSSSRSPAYAVCR